MIDTSGLWTAQISCDTSVCGNELAKPPKSVGDPVPVQNPLFRAVYDGRERATSRLQQERREAVVKPCDAVVLDDGARTRGDALVVPDLHRRLDRIERHRDRRVHRASHRPSRERLPASTRSGSTSWVTSREHAR
eukprot:3007333-Pleurochrysis_carterae.AAC.1